MKKRLALLNLLSVVLVIAVNYLSQALRLNNTTIGEISVRYDNLFTPASYAFAIWGLIFLGLLAYAFFQIKRAFLSDRKSGFIEQTGYWFVLANVLNAAWVFAFVYEYTGLSVLIMLGILFSLIKIILNTDMERFDAPIEIIAFAWWPICIYSGWIAVATIANISAYLVKVGWDGTPFSESTWTIVMIVIATLLNLAIIQKRNMREFAAVGVWALFAIFFRHKSSFENIAYTALAGSILLLMAIMIHGYRNRHTNPFSKLQERISKRQ
ncbi:tryptophan-rich sensory protein [Flavobacteriaceae bacterium TP-CH-4]|uniref:Tryptophan-rich sensory protein n=1 Tax=Pelagihabitans pacificus TaxID=2696054 RepID=A0A967AV90_9FLAO|nr:tryptophan-rich sensory protein [Pelagihabitans pacificus]NHF60609.1 tryptophan-rich sensory protein [Pelagihabitans pacificus]